MKTIYKIARTELQILFYSPIAWLILIIFAFQANTIFAGFFNQSVQQQFLGPASESLTLRTFSGFRGIFTQVSRQYLYLYIPLLTMGIMSSEFSRGSIKLLYSSPLTNTQIILGKYLALVFFALILTFILFIPGSTAILTINHADVPAVLSGLLGIFLLICTYAAIGLFVSSLTSYAVVAAIGTLTLLGFLNYAGNLWQEIPFVRDITYWFSISGRTDTFISGLITSEDLLYFPIVTALFLAFSILRLQNGRQHTGIVLRISRYAAVFLTAMLLGYLSSRPTLRLLTDVTRTNVNTLTKSSQEVMDKMKGGLKITTYVNVLDRDYSLALPAAQNRDMERFSQYLRFKPDIKMNYVYYYQKTDNKRLMRRFPKLSASKQVEKLSKIYNWGFKILPYSEISKEGVDLSGEKYHFVRLLTRENGKRTFLRVFDDGSRLPAESEISAAMKRLVTTDLPIVGFVKGHSERESIGEGDREYSMAVRQKDYRHALLNQGFDFSDVSLTQPVPVAIDILVIADPKTALTPTENSHLQAYINRGGNLLIAGEPGRHMVINTLTRQFGVEFKPGTLVQPASMAQPDLLILNPTHAALQLNNNFMKLKQDELQLIMPTAAAMSVIPVKSFRVQTLFASAAHSWSRTEALDLLNGAETLKPEVGETLRSYPTVLGLSRKQAGRDQKIIITADADWLSNGELLRYRNGIRNGNPNVSDGIFFWLSSNEVPIDMSRPRPTDVTLNIEKGAWEILAVLLKWIIPLIIASAGLLIWLRRRNR